MTPTALARRHPNVGVIAAFIMAAALEYLARSPSGQVTIPLTVGVAAWGVCWWRPQSAARLIPAFTLVAFLVGTPRGVSTAAGGAATLLFELVVLCAAHRRFGRTRDEGGVGPLIGIFAASLVAPFLAAVARTGVGLVADPGTALAMGWREFLPHVLGIIIVLPLAEAWRSHARFPRVEGTLVLLSVLVGLLAMYEQVSTGPLLSELSQYILLGALGWAAVRLGPKGVTVAMLFCAVGSPYWTAGGYGPFADLASDPARSLAAVQIATIVVAIVLEGGAVLIEDLRLTARDLRASAASLEIRQEELERRNAELAQFAYLSSHELQEPLRMLAAYLGLLADRYQGQLDEAAGEYIGIAVDSAGRLRTLVDDLLGYSQTGGVQAEFGSVPLGEVVDHLLAWRNEQILDADAEIVVGPLPSVRGDALLLRLVLDNLLSNALRYRRPDRRPRIEIDAEPFDDMFVVRVRDNGIGVPTDQLERVFEPFRRVHPRHRFPGTGLGLTIVANLVRKHGGRTWLEPSADGGLVVHFTVGAATEKPHRTGPRHDHSYANEVGAVAPAPLPPTKP